MPGHFFPPAGRGKIARSKYFYARSILPTPASQNWCFQSGVRYLSRSRAKNQPPRSTFPCVRALASPSISRGRRRNSSDGRCVCLSADPSLLCPHHRRWHRGTVFLPLPMANPNADGATAATRAIFVPPRVNVQPGFALPPPAPALKGKTRASKRPAAAAAPGAQAPVKKAPKVSASRHPGRTGGPSSASAP
jgi:hypothetical protein